MTEPGGGKVFRRGSDIPVGEAMTLDQRGTSST
jgi:hypothetical protein